MRMFLQFITASLRRSAGASIATGLLLAAGINVQAITWALFESPPWVLVQWWSPYPVVAVALLLVAWIFYRHNAAERFIGPQPDLSIAQAIDYLVNDSAANIERKPTMEGYEHSEARILLNEKFAEGTLRVWGRRDTKPGGLGHVFEISREPVPKDYWANARLDYYSIFYKATERPQTDLYDAADKSIPMYADLHINRREIETIWPHRPLWRRLVDKLRCVKLIKYPREDTRS